MWLVLVPWLCLQLQDWCPDREVQLAKKGSRANPEKMEEACNML